MIVAMLETATEDQIQDVTDHLMRMGFAVHRTTGARQSVIESADAAFAKRVHMATAAIARVICLTSILRFIGSAKISDGLICGNPQPLPPKIEFARFQTQ